MRRRLVILALAALVLVGWIAWGNTALMVSEYEVRSPELPEAFAGFRIAQVSDLHNAVFGDQNEALLTLITEAEPDIIVLTGDLIDSRRADVDTALAFAAEAVKIAPCYYVTGNHEARMPQDFSRLEAGLEALGVCVLRNRAEVVEREGQRICIAGVDDPAFGLWSLDGLVGEEYTVLLSHRPERFDEYCQRGADLVFSGHAHGGQFRLPLVGGLVAPDQGLFPEYDAGVFSRDGTTMLVSRGLGNSIIPFRFNNRPELVVAELAGE